MARILVVDDEEKICGLILKYAKFEGHEVCTAPDGMAAVEAAKTGSYDLIIMDVMMPELDGFSAVNEIRKTRDTPVLMLSARSEEYDRIHGFEAGADDYVTKPFSPRELMLRVEAILKRTRQKTGEANREIWRREGLVADITARTVSVDGKPASMYPKEYDLFFYLLKNRNIALSREKLIEKVWGYDFLGCDRTLDTHVKRLRKSLGAYAKFIVTLRGIGYRFEG
ncbi:MAG: response regulator transcription factor [Clostridiales Family XIII bacterium]|jgi:DNA-binding response OmpR family regulator|nr:response regulator transcription factor [Clostridiales Family XIII bacterium]